MPSLAFLKRYSCCAPIDAAYSTHGSSDPMNQHPWLISLLLSYSTLHLCCWMAFIMDFFFLQLLPPMVISLAPTCCGHNILNPSVWLLIPCCLVLLSRCFTLFFHLFTTSPDCTFLEPGTMSSWITPDPSLLAWVSQIFVGDYPSCLHALPPAPALLLPMTDFPFQLWPSAALACLLQISLK